MNARRYPDWQLRMEAFVRERRSQPFAWGSNDCALFAADCIQALTGARLLPQLRGYTTAHEALARIEQAGGLQAIATQALGAPVAPAFAAVGDLVLVPTGRPACPWALGICNGGTVLGPGDAGVVALGMSGAVVAWRVG